MPLPCRSVTQRQGASPLLKSWPARPLSLASRVRHCSTSHTHTVGASSFHKLLLEHWEASGRSV